MCLAIPGQILAIQGDDPLLRTGTVNFGGVQRRVHLNCVPEAREGDYVLVHVGMAISLIDQEEANRVFDYLRELGELDQLEDSSREIPG